MTGLCRELHISGLCEGENAERLVPRTPVVQVAEHECHHAGLQHRMHLSKDLVSDQTRPNPRKEDLLCSLVPPHRPNNRRFMFFRHHLLLLTRIVLRRAGGVKLADLLTS